MPPAPVVILTQEPADNAALAGRLAGHGINSLSYPCIETRVLPYDGHTLRGGRELEDFGVVAFTSKRAAAGLFPVRERLAAAAPVVACVGETTAGEVMSWLGLKCDISPARQTAAALAEEILSRLPAATPLLYARGDKTTGELQATLAARGWEVSELVVYENRAPQLAPLELYAYAAAVFASPSAAERFFSVNPGMKDSIACFAIGPVTGRSLRRLGVARVMESARPALAELAEAVCRAVKPGGGK